MKYITGQNRQQINLFPVSIDSSIDTDNEVRFIDAFVDSLPLEEFGFKVDYVENDRPTYHPSDLLKLYMYNYLNKIHDLKNQKNIGYENQLILKCAYNFVNYVS